MSNVVTINKGQLKSAVKRWLSLKASERKKLMRDNQYVCHMRMENGEIAVVHFTNPEGSYNVCFVELGYKMWAYNYKHREWKLYRDSSPKHLYSVEYFEEDPWAGQCNVSYTEWYTVSEIEALYEGLRQSDCWNIAITCICDTDEDMRDLAG